ncbi:21134_t:CDS:1, partial [Racocetra persica]
HLTFRVVRGNLKKYEIEILDYSQFRRDKPLGIGASADVYLRIFQGKEYALKCLK